MHETLKWIGYQLELSIVCHPYADREAQERDEREKAEKAERAKKEAESKSGSKENAADAVPASLLVDDSVKRCDNHNSMEDSP